jgi:hypothetical protein
LGENSEFGGEGIGCDGGVVAIVELYRLEYIKDAIQESRGRRE